MTREFLLNALLAKGIKAMPEDRINNGVTKPAIVLGEGRVRPVIYTDYFKEAPEEDIDAVVQAILNQIAQELGTEYLEASEKVLDWSYAKTRLQLCLQQKSKESICKRDFLDLELYVRINITEQATCKVLPSFLEKYNITEDTLFEEALKCTRKMVDIWNLLEKVKGEMRLSTEEVEAMPIQLVITTTNKIYGAGAICCIEELQHIADRYESDLVILPSSIHECILMPVDDNTCFPVLDAMVQNINKTELSPEQILSNQAYRFIRDTGKIMYRKEVTKQ